MSWLAIIAALLNLFGPLLMKWLEKWLDDLFRSASETLADPRAYGRGTLDEIQLAATAELFDAALLLHKSKRPSWWRFLGRWRHDRRAELLLALKPIALTAMAEGRKSLTPRECDILVPLVEEAA